MREKQSTMRHVCDHCGKEVLLTTPLQDYWQSDDPHPDGWYRVEVDKRGTNGSTDPDNHLRLDLCSDCGAQVVDAIRKPVPA